MPGFAVGFETHLFGFAVRIKTKHGRGSADFNGNDIPEIERDNVGDEEVDVAAGVDGASFAGGVGGASFVGAGAEGAGGFGLDADELASIVEDEVVALTVSPGFGDAEAEAGGSVEEGGFGALSGALGIAGAGEAGEGWLSLGRIVLGGLRREFLWRARRRKALGHLDSFLGQNFGETKRRSRWRLRLSEKTLLNPLPLF